MEVLKMVLDELGMTQYLPGFVENGFETWEDVLEITEIDLDLMGVKLGHRRRLQQRVAKERNDVRNRPTQHGEYSNYFKKKRRYQWHPKPDPNAPKKPLTAYAVFANEKRAELQYKGLSFPQMAIEIGRLWRELPEDEKKIAQARAICAREKYKLALAEYEKSESYHRHVRYLNEWRAKKCARKKARNSETKEPQRNTSSPQDTERSPVSTEISTESQLRNGLADESLSHVLPSSWVPAATCQMVEHISAAFGWTLSQKDMQNQVERGEGIFDNAPATLGSLARNMEGGDLDGVYEDAGVGCNAFWPDENHQ
ncbi:hypothetical protein AJ78_03373 [Emergomyces pasteurianus Ep9510]|uniref:HMG box domain-containing protein n=1 Tax=Emergomyces pasteurianus Ep9510 TaxID=1447872 RepID=A0A1J9PKS6_9EURO|nr:hypothetical protein AJ78_03373 [Emergomyces pasteurianus Ep9510]